MNKRCNVKTDKSYKNYGDKGIKVCDEWLSIENFINDMFPTYKEGLTLDRINNDKGYSLDNCRWTNRTVQSRNKRVIQINNKSGFKGVSIRNNRFRSMIRVNNKLIHLGTFETAIDAAKTYNEYIITNKLEHTLNVMQ